MAEQDKKDTKPKETDTLPKGVKESANVETQRQAFDGVDEVQIDGKEDKDAIKFMGAPIPQSTGPNLVIGTDPAEEAPVDDPVPAKEFKVEDDMYVLDLDERDTNIQTPERFKPAGAFNGDAFRGEGGRFVIDPQTGERKRLVERYTDEEGNAQIRKAL